jgi:hypothetical protein
MAIPRPPRLPGQRPESGLGLRSPGVRNAQSAPPGGLGSTRITLHRGPGQGARNLGAIRGMVAVVDGPRSSRQSDPRGTPQRGSGPILPCNTRGELASIRIAFGTGPVGPVDRGPRRMFPGRRGMVDESGAVFETRWRGRSPAVESRRVARTGVDGRVGIGGDVPGADRPRGRPIAGEAQCRLMRICLDDRLGWLESPPVSGVTAWGLATLDPSHPGPDYFRVSPQSPIEFFENHVIGWLRCRPRDPGLEAVAPGSRPRDPSHPDRGSTKFFRRDCLRFQAIPDQERRAAAAWARRALRLPGAVRSPKRAPIEAGAIAGRVGDATRAG